MGKHNLDIDGNLSSKRVWGGKLFNIGIVMGVILFIAGIWGIFAEKDLKYDLAMEVWWTFMAGGAALLGFTLFERFGKTKGTQSITPPPGTPPGSPPEGEE